MDELEKTNLALIQQSARLQAKIAPIIMASALLQEALAINQQLVSQIKALNDERTALKNPVRDASKVP